MFTGGKYAFVISYHAWDLNKINDEKRQMRCYK